jgi:outer membrane autotransporter protein
VEEGTLNGNTNNLRGTILVSPGATLGFRQASGGIFAGTITGGAGGDIDVNKIGAGSLTLGADQDFQGDLNVMEGELNFGPGVDLLTANLIVGSGVGPATLTSAFTPNDAGADNTVDIGGSLSFESNARLIIDLDESGGSPVRYAAGGPVTIDPAAQLFIRLQPGTYAGSPTLDILTGSGVTGDFSINQGLYFFDVTGAAAGGAYQITLNPSGNTLAEAATTSNQFTIGTELDAFRLAPSGGDPLIEEVQGVLTVSRSAEISGILEAVSPDDLAASTNTLLAASARTWRSLSKRLALHRKQSIGHHNSREARRAKARRERAERLRNRQRRTRRPSVDANSVTESPAPAQKPWVAWLEGNGALAEIESGDAKGYDYNLIGPLVGSDTAVTENLRVGFAAGYMYSKYEMTGVQKSKGDTNAVEGVLYGAWLGTPLEALIAARYSHAWVETDRRADFSTIRGSIDGDYEADIFGFYAEATRGFDLPYAIELAPLASIAYSHYMRDSFDESGTSPLRMQVDDSDTDSAVTSLGFRISTEREMDEGFLLRPRLKAAWNHEWADVERDVSGNFASAPVTGGSAFTVEGAELPRDHAEVSVGWEIGYGKNANLFLDWDGRFGSDFIENTISVGARVAW